MNAAKAKHSTARLQNIFWGLGFGIFLCVLTIWLYREILFAPAGMIPWGSDTLGHVLKAEYLRRSIENGIYYPNIFPGWYMGLQMLRYHPPLPYYLLVLIFGLTTDMVKASAWFIALSAFGGGLTWVLYRRWLGWLPALLGGVLFLFLPDNLRVALAEGNLPRVLATALFPLAVYFVLRLLDTPRRPFFILALAVTFTLILLSHAMMAAIYAVCCALLVILLWLFRCAKRQASLITIAVIAIGILLGGAWLLPSLVGGLTELDTSAVTEALATIPPGQYFNPFVRTNPEIVYVGAVLLGLSLLSLFWRRKNNGYYSLALILAALFGVGITLPMVNDFYNSLPLHGLMWPLRFLGAASFFMLLGLFWRVSKLEQPFNWPPVILFLLLLLDGSGSLHLIHLRTERQDVFAASQALAQSKGWREATLDDSRLSSEPAYFLTAAGGREQLFGWAYQGARTATNVAALNDAIHFGHIPYLLDRLQLYGVDDVLLMNNLDGAGNVVPALGLAGFSIQFSGADAALFHRDGAARAVAANWKVLGIGKGAQNLAYVFPQVITGSSYRVDDYAVDFLRRFNVIFLSGFTWSDRTVAEKILKQAATQGVQVIVDLTGTPEDPLAKIPHFLGVWGEPVILSDESIQLGEAQVGPFGSSAELWHALVPQGAQVDVLTFNYLGQKATTLGYNDYGRGKIWFVGLNMVYYAAQHPGTPLDDILAKLIELPAGQPSAYQSIPLLDYRTSPDGYDFSYSIERPTFVLLPFAAHEGYLVSIDGAQVEAASLENLITADLPAGQHRVVITFLPTRIYVFGWGASLVAALVLGLLIFRAIHPGDVCLSERMVEK
jgi:uncharacterized membrane protein